MMTTLHGLVTISELFAGFNLINTSDVQNTPKKYFENTK